ncbi:MAG: porin [Rubrivivax sp.]|nr:MAG: porin [Rubrivivax sp.]
MFAKKNLVAAAALLALVGAAQADVKIYGSAEASFGSFETAHAKNLTTSSRVTAVESGNMMTSFIGFSGSEDLGGGLKAEFALETFVGFDKGNNIKNNADQFWSRTSNVALSGGFGKVALGQYDNPLFTSGYTYNPFGSSMPFSPTMRHLNYINQTAGTGAAAIAGAGASFDTGWINSITYESPNLSGFSFVGQAALKESNAANTKNSYSLAGTYAAGPFGATLTYVKSGFTPAFTGGLQTYNGEEKIIDLGASYDFGAVKLFAQYTDIKEDANVSAVTADNKDRIYQVGVSVPVTEKGSILASYGELKHEIKSGASAGLEAKDRVFSLGYDHFLSKRTDVYAVFSNHGQTNLESGQTFAVGIKHAF